MAQENILVIDYGVGNCQSVTNALQALGAAFVVSSDLNEIARAQAYVLPGVGAFPEAMKNIDRRGFRSALEKEVLGKKKPLLGICLGMQILAQDSQEKAYCRGLGWIDGHIRRLQVKAPFRVPNVGWHRIQVIRPEPLFVKTEPEQAFFFDHSYHFVCADDVVSARCDCGSDIVVAVQKENIMGVQFHPEKSQNNGLKLFRGFLNHIDQWQAGSV